MKSISYLSCYLQRKKGIPTTKPAKVLKWGYLNFNLDNTEKLHDWIGKAMVLRFWLENANVYRAQHFDIYRQAPLATWWERESIQGMREPYPSSFRIDQSVLSRVRCIAPLHANPGWTSAGLLFGLETRPWNTSKKFSKVRPEFEPQSSRLAAQRFTTVTSPTKIGWFKSCMFFMIASRRKSLTFVHNSSCPNVLLVCFDLETREIYVNQQPYIQSF